MKPNPPPSGVRQSSPPTTKPAAKNDCSHPVFSRFTSSVRSGATRFGGLIRSLLTIPTKQSVNLQSTDGLSARGAGPQSEFEKAQLSAEAELAAYPYHRSLNKIREASLPFNEEPLSGNNLMKNLGSWETDPLLADNAGKACGLSARKEDAYIFDKESGLVAYLLKNPKTKELRLIFGGTTAGDHTGGLAKRSFLNRKFSFRQWIANIKNASPIRNGIPDSYNHAKNLTTQVLLAIKSDENYKDYTFKLCGHSKGSAEASYAALKQEEVPETTCFSSAELGKSVLNSISEEKLKSGKKKIIHYNINYDPVPNIGRPLRALRQKIGHVGEIVKIPAKNWRQGPIDRHDKFTRQIHHFTQK